MKIAISKKAYENDPFCGDECAFWEDENTVTLCVVDGIGHGEAAEYAAKEAVAYIGDHLGHPIPELFEGCNIHLRKTRGVALGLAVIDRLAKTLTYAGVGNIRAFVMGRSTIRFSSNYGIIGGGYRRLTPETHPVSDGGLLMMYTDGLKEMIDLFEYDGDQLRDIKTLSRKLIEDWGRDDDDAGILIYQHENNFRLSGPGSPEI